MNYNIVITDISAWKDTLENIIINIAFISEILFRREFVASVSRVGLKIIDNNVELEYIVSRNLSLGGW